MLPSSPRDFSGLWIPLVTPFHGDAVDHTALTRLVKHCADAGVSGFVACGSTGEAAALDKTEQLAVLQTVLEASGNLPVIMGLSGYHLGDTVKWVKELAKQPIVGLLTPAPHYIRPSQAGLAHWFNTLADATDKPLVLYDIPYRTGANITVETLLSLADHPNIQAMKDCGGDARKTQAAIAHGGLQVLAGEDAQTLSLMALGGVGTIAASAHLRTAQFVEVVRLMLRGDLQQARPLWRPLVPLIEAAFAEPNPALIKAVLAQQGLMHNELRLPMTVGSAEGTQRLLQLLR